MEPHVSASVTLSVLAHSSSSALSGPSGVGGTMPQALFEAALGLGAGWANFPRDGGFCSPKQASRGIVEAWRGSELTQGLTLPGEIVLRPWR